MTPERKARIERVLNNRQPDLAVVMENVHDPHNISAVMRTCDAVGIQEIYVLNTKIASHTRFGKKSSASAADWLTIHHFDNLEACFEVLKKRYDKIYATHLGEHSYSLYDLDLTGPVALLFGNEHDGVSKEALVHCSGNFVIPMMGMVKSLNISVACAVTLYEGLRQRKSAGYYGGEARLPKEQWSILADKWGLMED